MLSLSVWSVLLLTCAPLGAGVSAQPSITMQLIGEPAQRSSMSTRDSRLQSRRTSFLRGTTSLLAEAPGLGESNGRISASLQVEQRLFLTQVELGDGQSFSMLVDTGSGSLTVPAQSCNSVACLGHRRFRPEEDSAGHFLGLETSDIRLSYASGLLAGSGFEGHVCLAVQDQLGKDGEDMPTSESGKARCGNLRFVVASMVSNDFKAYRFDGILGLGPPQQGAGKGFNVIESLFDQHVLREPSFVLALRSKGSSTLTLGSAESDCLDQNLSSHESQNATFDLGNVSNEADSLCRSGQRLPVDVRHGEWAATMDDVSVDGMRLNACGAEGCRAVFDSGCAGIAMPRKIMKMLRARLPRNECAYSKLMPTLGFVFEGRSFDVNSDRYVQISENDPSQCRVLVNEIDEDVSTRTIILGIPFLLDRTVRFDQRRMQITL